MQPVALRTRLAPAVQRVLLVPPPARPVLGKVRAALQDPTALHRLAPRLEQPAAQKARPGPVARTAKVAPPVPKAPSPARRLPVARLARVAAALPALELRARPDRTARLPKALAVLAAARPALARVAAKAALVALVPERATLKAALVLPVPEQAAQRMAHPLKDPEARPGEAALAAPRKVVPKVALALRALKQEARLDPTAHQPKALAEPVAKAALVVAKAALVAAPCKVVQVREPKPEPELEQKVPPERKAAARTRQSPAHREAPAHLALRQVPVSRVATQLQEPAVLKALPAVSLRLVRPAQADLQEKEVPRPKVVTRPRGHLVLNPHLVASLRLPHPAALQGNPSEDLKGSLKAAARPLSKVLPQALKVVPMADSLHRGLSNRVLRLLVSPMLNPTVNRRLLPAPAIFPVFRPAILVPKMGSSAPLLAQMVRARTLIRPRKDKAPLRARVHLKVKALQRVRPLRQAKRYLKVKALPPLRVKALALAAPVVPVRQATQASNRLPLVGLPRPIVECAAAACMFEILRTWWASKLAATPWTSRGSEESY